MGVGTSQDSDVWRQWIRLGHAQWSYGPVFDWLLARLMNRAAEHRRSPVPSQEDNLTTSIQHPLQIAQTGNPSPLPRGLDR
ncbi:hypothetical protein RRG08_017708 [Elysia crispata]|uniref:Uncharacterized protein n=1 Tax=Elysia crispata TaxID=231223 RepID=A0AAE0YHQ8_9GAST|nr:hypothetical protein RRG08_017708 [Elysia crispata]